MLTIKAGSNITYDWINEQSLQKFDEMIPDKSATAGHVQNPPSSVFTGWNLFHREVSCFCKYADLTTCMCYKPVLVNLGSTTCHTKVPSNTPKAAGLEDLSGKFVIITYDELPYVGQVLKVVGEDVQVSSMRQSDEKNVFMWPQISNIIFKTKKTSRL